MIRLTSATVGKAWALWGTCTAWAICTACSTPDPTPRAGAALHAAAPAASAAQHGMGATTPAVAVSPPAAPARAVKAQQASVSVLKVKRLVVTTGVKDREPVPAGDALLANGSPIYAFAELSNPGADSENVRITFERKGGAERVGNVTLPVPGQVGRHRTWAVTRFIHAAGVWDAVLWSESGAELGRTSFEVTAS